MKWEGRRRRSGEQDRGGGAGEPGEATGDRSEKEEGVQRGRERDNGQGWEGEGCRGNWEYIGRD